jgi:hypothetical protein
MEYSDEMERLLSQPLAIQEDLPKSTGELVFDSILVELMKIMLKNADNYCIVREWYKDLIDDASYIIDNPMNGQKCNQKVFRPTNGHAGVVYIYKYEWSKQKICNDDYGQNGYVDICNPLLYVHNLVCNFNNEHTIKLNCIPSIPKTKDCTSWIKYREYVKEYEKISKEYKKTAYCRFCKFSVVRPLYCDNNPCTNYPPRYNLYPTDSYNKKPDVCYLNLAGYNSWLRTHYKTILTQIIKHDKLFQVIQHTTSYDELYSMFAKTEAFPTDKYNEFEFMLMIAFLGNNGQPHNLYDEIKLNPEW